MVGMPTIRIPPFIHPLLMMGIHAPFIYAEAWGHPPAKGRSKLLLHPLLPPRFGIYAEVCNCGGEITSDSAGVTALCIVGANAVAVKINKSALQLNGVPEDKKMVNNKAQ